MADEFARNADLKGMPERRQRRSREELLAQVASEFKELQGMSLSPAQASRLFGLEQDRCDRVFEELIRRGFLERTAEGHYVRRD